MREPTRELPGFLSVAGVVAAASAAAAVLAWIAVTGPAPFSPGALNAVKTGRVIGGVSSHAETSCGACHTAPWDAATMGDRCVACHADIRAQLRSGKGQHAHMAGTLASPSCRGCHTEHRGPAGALTFFDHDALSFKLTGAHVTLACDLCHGSARTLSQYRAAPRECIGCHRKTDPHKGAFGRGCDRCHDTRAWEGARFDHRVFPTDHGSEERKADCRTCHPVDVSRYTCFGCHEHTAANVVGEHEGKTLDELRDCIRCHRGGRTEGD